MIKAEIYIDYPNIIPRLHGAKISRSRLDRVLDREILSIVNTRSGSRPRDFNQDIS